MGAAGCCRSSFLKQTADASTGDVVEDGFDQLRVAHIDRSSEECLGVLHVIEVLRGIPSANRDLVHAAQA